MFLCIPSNHVQPSQSPACQMTGLHSKAKRFHCGSREWGILEFILFDCSTVNHYLCTPKFAFHIAVEFYGILFFSFPACKNEKVALSAQCVQKQVLGQILPMGCSLVAPDQSDLYIVPIALNLFYKARITLLEKPKLLKKMKIIGLYN